MIDDKDGISSVSGIVGFSDFELTIKVVIAGILTDESYVVERRCVSKVKMLGDTAYFYMNKKDLIKR
jgi:hypothetical protein